MKVLLKGERGGRGLEEEQGKNNGQYSDNR
jgi:hypothetical protein